MPKSADIGSKRLISLAPVEWVRIMRWDMAVLMQSPWYQEIVEERVRKDILVGLDVRFGPVPPVSQSESAG